MIMCLLTLTYLCLGGIVALLVVARCYRPKHDRACTSYDSRQPIYPVRDRGMRLGLFLTQIGFVVCVLGHTVVVPVVIRGSLVEWTWTLLRFLSLVGLVVSFFSEAVIEHRNFAKPDCGACD